MWAALRWAAGVPRRHPVVFGCVFSCTKTSTADVLCQTQVEGRPWAQVDWRRTAIFSLWGFGYLGGVQYFLYAYAFPRAFPGAVKFIEAPLAAKLRDRRGLATLAKQVACDQLIHHPFVVFPCFYLTKAFVEGHTAAAALAKCRENWITDCVVSWRVWMPVFVVNFSVCPLWARVPFVACASFGFTIYWSLLRGAPSDASAEKETAERRSPCRVDRANA